MTIGEWLESLKTGELGRISADSGVPIARFYEAARVGVKTTRHARRLSAATGGAVCVASLLGLTPEECGIVGKNKVARAA